MHVLRHSLLAAALVSGCAASALAQIPTAGLTAHWKFDETGTTQIATDSTANGHDGTLTNGASWTSGKLNGAVLLDGVDDVVVVSNTAGLQGSAFAISAWVKYTATDTSGGDVANMGDSYGLRVQPNGTVKAYFFKGGGVWPNSLSTATTNDGTWHHIVGQYDGSTLAVYVDGVQSGTPTAVSGAIVYALGPNFLLGQNGQGGTNHNFHGSIDQVRVYNRALTPAEIQALYGEAPVNTTTFKVLEWNIRKGRATDNGDSVLNFTVADFIKNTANADVAMLSAVQNLTEAGLIRDRLNANDPNGPWKMHYEKAVNPANGEGQAIYARFPMSQNPADLDFLEVSCPNATENQVIVHAVVTIGGLPINFFAIDQQHLSGNSAVRECQANAFRDWANSKPGARVVAGDFNATPGDLGITTWLTPPSPHPASEGFTDGWATAPTKSG
jgi:endonuclease/exonuclease/phosphatase family metal-dependent hydrolase